jgi:polyhydroxybutyrate depolymerase
MFKFMTLVAICVFAVSAQAETIVVNGIVREYILDVPKISRPVPLIVALHGGLGSAKQLRKTIGLTALANPNGVAVVYPNGINKGWNDGRVNRRGQLIRDTDDVGFIAALVNDLVARGIANPDHIVFSGISNGGHMSLKMACDSTVKTFGVVVVSANIPEPLDCTHTSTKFLNIVGTADRLVPMSGGKILRGSDKSAKFTFENFLTTSGCTGTRSTKLPDIADDAMTSVMVSGTGCKNGPVAQIIVENGGHAWAGSRGQIEFITGKPTMDFSATQMLVDFTLGRNLN